MMAIAPVPVTPELLEKQLRADDAEQELAGGCSAGRKRRGVLDCVTLDELEDRAVPSSAVTHRGSERSSSESIGALKPTLRRCRARVRCDSAGRVAQHRLRGAVPDQMPGRDAVGELDQCPVEEGRAVLDREVHRVEVVLVQDHRHRLVQQLVQHAVAQEVGRVALFGERLGPWRSQSKPQARRRRGRCGRGSRRRGRTGRVAEVGVAHERPHVPLPRCERAGVERLVAAAPRTGTRGGGRNSR